MGVHRVLCCGAVRNGFAKAKEAVVAAKTASPQCSTEHSPTRSAGYAP
ncbi:hypothetical protein MCBRY_002330 [Methylocystis bryophila]